jgi:hypothetical protein
MSEGALDLVFFGDTLSKVSGLPSYLRRGGAPVSDYAKKLVSASTYGRQAGAAISRGEGTVATNPGATAKREAKALLPGAAVKTPTLSATPPKKPPVPAAPAAPSAAQPPAQKVQAPPAPTPVQPPKPTVPAPDQPPPRPVTAPTPLPAPSPKAEPIAQKPTPAPLPPKPLPLPPAPHKPVTPLAAPPPAASPPASQKPATSPPPATPPPAAPPKPEPVPTIRDVEGKPKSSGASGRVPEKAVESAPQKPAEPPPAEKPPAEPPPPAQKPGELSAEERLRRSESLAAGETPKELSSYLEATKTQDPATWKQMALQMGTYMGPQLLASVLFPDNPVLGMMGAMASQPYLYGKGQRYLLGHDPQKQARARASWARGMPAEQFTAAEQQTKAASLNFDLPLPSRAI